MTKKMKKLAAMGLSMVLAIGTMSGCTAGNSEGTARQDDGAATGAAGSRQAKKTFQSLDGMEITIGDWYTAEEEDAGTSDYARALQKYRKEIQEKYNFKITRKSVSAFQDMQSDFVTRVMANDPACDLYYLYQEDVAQPLMNGLMKNLANLPEFDFTEEKWNKTVIDLMTIGDGIWGMSTEREPRGGIYFNKRMLKEAGIPENEPYDLQAAGEWTWEKFEEYCKKLTRDFDGDGKVDQYAMASFSKYYLPMCVATNNANFIERDENGVYKNVIGTSAFKDALNWGMSLMEKNYVMPKPASASAWDWYKAAFRDGEVAMQTSEAYETTSFMNMDDEWGFVLFPYNQSNSEATNKWIPNDNIIVMPVCIDDEKAEKIAFAYDLYTEPTPGYTLEEAYREGYYDKFRDDRAVDETLMMMLEDEHKQDSYVPMISEIETGDICYSVYARAVTPAQQIEKISSVWDKRIQDANDAYGKFASENK